MGDAGNGRTQAAALPVPVPALADSNNSPKTDVPFDPKAEMNQADIKHEDIFADIKHEDIFATHGSVGIKDFFYSVFQACGSAHTLAMLVPRLSAHLLSSRRCSQADEPPKEIVQPSAYKLGRLASSLDNYFRITERGSTFAIEAAGGMTTFFSMCYILVLNGIIIAGPFNTGIPVRGVFFATALASGAGHFGPPLFRACPCPRSPPCTSRFPTYTRHAPAQCRRRAATLRVSRRHQLQPRPPGIFTFLMGVLVNVPVALAPGMGLNGYFSVIAGSVRQRRVRFAITTRLLLLPHKRDAAPWPSLPTLKHTHAPPHPAAVLGGQRRQLLHLEQLHGQAAPRQLPQGLPGLGQGVAAVDRRHGRRVHLRLGARSRPAGIVALHQLCVFLLHRTLTQSLSLHTSPTGRSSTSSRP